MDVSSQLPSNWQYIGEFESGHLVLRHTNLHDQTAILSLSLLSWGLTILGLVHWGGTDVAGRVGISILLSISIVFSVAALYEILRTEEWRFQKQSIEIVNFFRNHRLSTQCYKNFTLYVRNISLGGDIPVIWSLIIKHSKGEDILYRGNHSTSLEEVIKLGRVVSRLTCCNFEGVQ